MLYTVTLQRRKCQGGNTLVSGPIAVAMASITPMCSCISGEVCVGYAVYSVQKHQLNMYLLLMLEPVEWVIVYV